MQKWEYKVESMTMADRWSAKKTRAGVERPSLRVEHLGVSGMGVDLLREHSHVRLV